MPFPSLYHFQRQAYRQLLEHSREHLIELLIKAYTYQQSQQEEQYQILSLLATFALGLGYSCGVYRLPADLIQEPGWEWLLLIDIPAGQLCWPVDTAHLPYFRAMMPYQGLFLGFPQAKEQTRRLLRPGCTFLPLDPTERIPVVLPDEPR